MVHVPATFFTPKIDKWPTQAGSLPVRALCLGPHGPLSLDNCCITSYWFADTAFKQQRLPACRPIFTPLAVRDAPPLSLPHLRFTPAHKRLRSPICDHLCYQVGLTFLFVGIPFIIIGNMVSTESGKVRGPRRGCAGESGDNDAGDATAASSSGMQRGYRLL